MGVFVLNCFLQSIYIYIHVFNVCERFPSLDVGLEVVTGIHRHFKAIWEGVIFTDPSETCTCHLCVLD